MKSKSIRVKIYGKKVEAWVENVGDGQATLMIDGWCVVVVTKEGKLSRCQSIENEYLKTDKFGRIKEDKPK